MSGNKGHRHCSRTGTVLTGSGNGDWQRRDHGPVCGGMREAVMMTKTLSRTALTGNLSARVVRCWGRGRAPVTSENEGRRGVLTGSRSGRNSASRAAFVVWGVTTVTTD